MIRRRELYAAVAEATGEPIPTTSKICLELIRQLSAIAYCHNQDAKFPWCVRSIHDLLRDVRRGK